MISVIIPVRNGAKFLRNCLDGVQNQQGLEQDFEVIVIDDGSTDETKEIAQTRGVRVLSQDAAGPAAARNKGAYAAHGEILVFTDVDCTPHPFWLSYLTQPFKEAHIVGAKGAYRTKQKSLVARFVQQEYESKYARLLKQEYIDFIDTYSAAYRRDVFIQNRGFDPAFVVPSVEDQEFSFRLARKGYHMVFVPEAIVYHQHDGNLSEYFKRKFGIGYWKAFMLRWLPEKTLSDSHTLPSQRWQILLLSVAAFLFFLGFFQSLFWWLAVVSGILFYLTGLPLLIQIYQRDPSVLLVALPLLTLRAIAQTIGLTAGFIFPPRTQQRQTAGFTLPQRLAKRSLDIVGGILGLLLSIPFLLICAIAIKLEDGGAVFFSQERVGENGKPFRILKLRTMVKGADKEVEELIKNNPLEEPVFKFRDDPRVTRVGRFLRRWSLDELPQFWNVLRGEMSLVGPRPEETWVVVLYNDEQRQRLAVKPGITGPMQVSGRGELNMHERLALELDYIHDYSFGRDLWLILKTLPAIIKGEGAF